MADLPFLDRMHTYFHSKCIIVFSLALLTTPRNGYSTPRSIQIHSVNNLAITPSDDHSIPRGIQIQPVDNLVTTPSDDKSTLNGIAVHSAGYRQQCPFDNRCSCQYFYQTKKTFSANCSKRRIRSVPKTSANIASLDLSDNLISIIPNNIFHESVVMQVLDLSFNNISVILNESFNGLRNLLHLNLSGNNLRYNVHVFGHKSFHPLLSIQSLNIEKNVGFYTAGQTYPNISVLKNLETLIMDGVNDEMLGTKLKCLTNLKYIKMSNLTGVCDLNRLNSNVFRSTPHLQKIEINGCLLEKIERGTFKHLANLTLLDLSFNEHLTFNGIIDAFYDLQFTSIKTLKINKIYTTFHLNTIVPRKLVEPLQNTSLEHLEIDSNRIQIIETGALSKLPKTLVKISAADNSFTVAPYVLESLYLSIEWFNISNLYATHNYYTGKIFKRETVRKKVIHEINVQLPIPKKLRTMFINRCLLRFDVPKTTLFENNMEHIDFSENLVTSWIGPVINARKIKYADFSQNFCSNVSEVFFSDLINVETLLLQNNLLGFIIPADTEGKILSHLSKLKILNLNQNRISHLPTKFFKSQSALESLDLSSNLIFNMTFDILHMRKLNYLDLSNNEIRYLSPSTFYALEEINYHGNLTINLLDNPLVCECESLEFIKWLSITNVQFKNFHKYVCYKQGGTEIKLKQISIVYQKLLKDCSNFKYLILALSICLFLFLVIVVVGIVYRFRWKLRYMYYMTKQRYHNYSAVENNADFLYDAFISYADENEAFVHGEMLEQLETRFGMKLCLHKRDFLPGQDIAQNITDAVHKSYRTVIVMSRHFIKSYWCMFEFNMARMESVYSRHNDNVMFMILYEKIPIHDMPLSVLELIRTETFIEYPADETVIDAFWAKVKEAVII